MHPAALDPEQLLKDCDIASGRGSGPGGQHRNKVETAVRITHRPTGLMAAATERRYKEQNRKAALFRLRVKLAVEYRDPIDPAAPPSRTWSARVNDRKLMVNPSHEDFPALLAEAMDRVAMFGLDVSGAAKMLGVSVSQLLKLIKHEPVAMDRINQQRESAGMHRLK